MAAEHNDEVMDSRESLLVRSATVPGMAVAGVAVLAMMFIGAADIVGVLFSYPIPGALEMTQALMVVVIFLALPQIEARREHVTVDMVVRRVRPAVRRVFLAISDVLALVYFSAMAWQGWILSWKSWEMREYAPGSISFPIYPSKALFALGVTLVCVVVAVNIWRSLRSPRN
jgi:TRAP-type C4-dicarboxylate transport system permease small subunit